jgi:hypothetical protein
MIVFLQKVIVDRDFSRVSRVAISGQANRIWKSDLVCDLEDVDFLHCEMERTCENSCLVQAGAVTAAKAAPTQPTLKEQADPRREPISSDSDRP